MSIQTRRMILLAAMWLLGALLYSAWIKDYPSASEKTSDAQTAKEAVTDIPSAIAVKDGVPLTTLKDPIVVETDVMKLMIDPAGGDIVKCVLTQYAENSNQFGDGFILLDNSEDRYYVAQSGLAGDLGPDIRGVGRAVLSSDKSYYTLDPQSNKLVVEMKGVLKKDTQIIKRFIFTKGSYIIHVEYTIHNAGSEPYQGSFYARLKRKPPQEQGHGFLGAQTFTGAAVYTEKTPFKKLSFKDLKSDPFSQTILGGYAAMVEHYFLNAWIPAKAEDSHYQAQKLEEDVYSVGYVQPMVTVAPGTSKTISNTLYSGPEIQSTLKELAPGLEHAVDYGILWPICQPIFWLLKQLFDLTHNWGGAIILTTVIIKLLFYKLSASSYRSMGHMRQLQPKLELIKQRYGDDKQKMSQAVMEMYKKEKINPLGGCLPILVQIPVFIALYYVLLGSVELREAPFIGWITDLSAKDPYYVLPLLMGASMFVQQRLNPTPADPVQAKVMMFMPIVFTVLFLNFPAGLVLYWFVNNMLSIAQQWFIMRSVGTSKGHGSK